MKLRTRISKQDNYIPCDALNENKRIKRFNINKLNEFVWTIDNFITETELNYLNNMSLKSKWISSPVDSDDNNGEEIRTSKTMILPDVKIIRNIQYRIFNLLNIEENVISENPQMIRYTDKQENNLHHDAGILYDDGSIELQHPTRHWTVLIYLNDVPHENDGSTIFPKLNIKIHPEKYKALIFANIYNGEPIQNMVHYGEKFTSSENCKYKLAMNMWMQVM
jgi:prolyl 4-hydroxylase